MYTCQFCLDEDLAEVLYLGSLPPVNDMRLTDEKQMDVTSFPLPFCHCEKCGLTQIGVSLEKEVVFPNTYPYLSGMTKSLLANFAEQAEQVHSYMNLNADDLIVDIGSNDGSLLKNYSRLARVLGVEPTQAADAAELNEVPTLKMYFEENSVEHINKVFGKARVVTACNVFAHISDIPSLVQNVDSILSQDGIFVSESHYLVDLVQSLQFDTIYHEHLRYYTVTFLQTMMRRYGFEVFRVDSIASHGGSIRVWASRKGQHPITDSVEEFLHEEKEMNIISLQTLEKFSRDVINWRNDFRSLISGIIASGGKIGALGAPSRASTLIAFTGLTELDILGVGEVPNSAKIGKDMPGTRIPVVTESKLLSLEPTHLLVLSWHIKDPIMRALREKGFRGRFIIPLPTPEVV